ncbi:MAG TPA: glycosyltransferase family 39 protein [Burkholderiales bacterium]|nr:glycosyltransferase family 39 protein [Burkholderiales bacterium]
MNALASDPRRLFWGAIAATIALRFVLAWWLPVTGDEAYFVYWGESPALGVYDHPPMVGWFLAALLAVGHSPVWIRLPAILAPALVAIAMRATVTELARGRPDARSLGDWAALAWLLVPVQVLNVLITTDTPLLLFSFASIAAYALAVRRRSLALCALAGVALGLAFLSKYFAVLLGLAYVVYAAAIGRDARAWRELAVVVACAVPFGLVNLAWNYEHCWANLMFNVYNRHAGAGFAWYRPLVFLALLVYVAGALLLFDLACGRRMLRESIRDPAVALLAACAAVPTAVFFVLSAVKTIGLHWLFAFMPPLFMAGALVLGPARLAASAKSLAAFSAVHLVVVAVVAVLPLETWQRSRYYDSLVMGFRPGEFLAALQPYAGRYVFAASSYAVASLLSYDAAEQGFIARSGAAGDGPEPWRAHYFPVFGAGSANGRHDDILTDFRPLDGKDILVVRKTAAEAEEYRPYFRSIEMREITVRGAKYFLVLGQGFNYAAYRDRVLAEVRDRYYRIPRYLPQGRCYLCERYWATATCPVP